MRRGIPRTVSTPLISVAELTKLDRSNVVIFDCRFDVAKPGWGRAQYEAGHIAGAFFAWAVLRATDPGASSATGLDADASVVDAGVVEGDASAPSDDAFDALPDAAP